MTLPEILDPADTCSQNVRLAEGFDFAFLKEPAETIESRWVLVKRRGRGEILDWLQSGYIKLFSYKD